MTATTPYRVVDREDQGWYLSDDGLYHADYGFKRDLEPTTYDDLAERRGPLRPVEPVTDDHADLICKALRVAGTKAAGSVAVALYRLHRARSGDPAGSRPLLAGREGSWESAGLGLLAWELGSRIAEKPGRFDADTVMVLVDTIESWVTDPTRYTEVAETLAHLFGQVADKAGGWDKAADRYLQPGTRFEQTGTRALYGYLMSTAATFDTGLL